MRRNPAPGEVLPHRHIMTVAVEDYFHVAAFRGAVQARHWERMEPRLDRCLDLCLDLLGRYQQRATFFVLGWVAERAPAVVRRIVEAGHEVASRGYWPRSIEGLSPADLREDLRRTREALEAAGSPPVVGHRFGSWLGERDLWVLEVLAEEGYLYDSSINPALRRTADKRISFEAAPYRIPGRDLLIWELPVSTVSLGWLRLPISGGNYTRQLPHPIIRRLIASWHARREAPLVYYFMPWELDGEQPQVTAVSRLNRIRTYRNLERTRGLLEEYLLRYRFMSIADYLGLPTRRTLHEARPDEGLTPSIVSDRTLEVPAPDRPEVALVVPLYNEEQNLAYLARALEQVRGDLGRTYRLHLLLVDDGSTDKTLSALHAHFDGLPDCRILTHGRNRGVAAALLTGIREAPCEVVCTIDCDLSYDPQVLSEMIPRLEAEGADLVTASPYHPRGRVRNVPGWRLFLSKNLSRLYSLMLGERLYTYTSCCRVHRRSALSPIRLHYPGFLGVAEMLICLKLRGGRIVEHPATLESRLFGFSKMKTLRTIRGHLRILVHLARDRCPGGHKRTELCHSEGPRADRLTTHQVDNH